jgi:hypothetical protein
MGDEVSLDKDVVLRYYKRLDVQKAVCESAKDKEIGIKYDFGFGRRPDIISNPADVFELAKHGATSFHFSEELWKNPLVLSPNLSEKELLELRSGWDLVIDIDMPYFEYSKITAFLVVEALKRHGIGCVSCKFSGNKGFHIGVPFEAFPKSFSGRETRSLFPEAPRKIALYLKELIKKPLAEMIFSFEKGDKDAVVRNIGRDRAELKGSLYDFDAVKFVEMDTLLISTRHLCRMPYCFNEKSGLVSVPVPLDKVLDFKREYASPEKVEVKLKFLDRSLAVENEALALLMQAYEFNYFPPLFESGEKKEIEFEEIAEAVPEQLFPPCMQKILQGMDDGRKRALFVLINFLSYAGWSSDMIEQRVKEWNVKNKEPLREVYVKSQLRYAKKSERKLPPNCVNADYYKGINICFPDGLCSKVRNPVNYARRKAFAGKDKKAKK